MTELAIGDHESSKMFEETPRNKIENQVEKALAGEKGRGRKNSSSRQSSGEDRRTVGIRHLSFLIW